LIQEGVMTIKERVANWWWRAREEKLDTRSRLTSAALGIWTVVSAFHWRDRYQFTSTVITGVVIAVCALLAWVRTPWARVGTTAAAVWLFFSPILLPYQQKGLLASQWLVSLVVMVCSFFPLWGVSVDEGEILPPVPHHA
jgi:hypothetical protein